MKINVKIKIKNTDFTIACEAGEEEKIKKLANSLDRRIALLSDSFPNTNLMTLFLVNSIMMEDEINDLKAQIIASSQWDNQDYQNERAEEIAGITDHIENIIEKIKQI